MQQHAPGPVYHPSDRMTSSQHASYASQDRPDAARAGQDYHVHQVERQYFDNTFLSDSRSRPGVALDFSSRGSEQSQSHIPRARSPGRSEEGISASIMAVGRRLREEMSVIGHDQKQLQDNILFEIDRIAARMSEQEAILRDLQGELRRLLELHGVETAPQKQHLHSEPVFPANTVNLNPHLRVQYHDSSSQRGQYFDLPSQSQPAAPSIPVPARTYTAAGSELAAYTQSWPSSANVGIPNNFRRTLDEAHM